MFTPHITIVVQKRAAMPGMISSGNKTSIDKTIVIFINKLKNPKVNILNGVVINRTIGLIKEFMIPIAIPTKMRSCQLPVNSTCGTTRSASQKPITPAILCMKSIFTFGILPRCDQEVNPFVFIIIFNADS